MKKKECVFCQMLAGKAKHYLVSQNRLSFAILDINPFSQGHTLVISKRHEPFWHDLSEEEVKSLFSLARKVAGKLKKAFKPDFVAVYARGRRIPHMHVFLVPTFKGDPLDRFFSALEGFQESPQRFVELRTAEALERTEELIRGT
jgi:histidine triad (HIT) family protein